MDTTTPQDDFETNQEEPPDAETAPDSPKNDPVPSPGRPEETEDPQS